MSPTSETAAPPFADQAQSCRQAQVLWARSPLRQRLRPLRALRRLFVAEADRLCQAVEHDIARPPSEVLGTDLLPTADAFRFLQCQAPRILRPRHVPVTQRPLWLWGQRDTVYRRPHGVVGIIGTWNYPIYLNAIQIAQALTAGNGVLWKPSELTQDCSALLHELFGQAGYAPELFQRLPATREAGPLLAEADVDHVVFTGSAAVGRKLAARLGERLISSTLELSGCDALFVLADADVALAARAFWFAATLNRGQTCLAVRRAFVERSVYPAFLAALEPLVREPRPMPLVTPAQVDQAERLIKDALSSGARLVASASAGTAHTGTTPAIVCDARPEMSICQEASFAPISAIVPFDDVAQALAMNAECPYGLGASVFTSNASTAFRIAAALQVGVVAINDTVAPVAHPSTPFGGRGASGWGVTQGQEGLLGMTVPQVVSTRSGAMRLHYTPMSDAPHLAESIRGVLELSHGTPRQRWTGLKRVLRQVRNFLK